MRIPKETIARNSAVQIACECNAIVQFSVVRKEGKNFQPRGFPAVQQPPQRTLAPATCENCKREWVPYLLVSGEVELVAQEQRAVIQHNVCQPACCPRWPDCDAFPACTSNFVGRALTEAMDPEALK